MTILDDEPPTSGDMDRADAEAREERDEAHGRKLFGEHPDGIGPTLGQDLGRPNPGKVLEDDLEDQDEDGD